MFKQFPNNMQSQNTMPQQNMQSPMMNINEMQSMWMQWMQQFMQNQGNNMHNMHNMNNMNMMNTPNPNHNNTQNNVFSGGSQQNYFNESTPFGYTNMSSNHQRTFEQYYDKFRFEKMKDNN